VQHAHVHEPDIARSAGELHDLDLDVCGATNRADQTLSMRQAGSEEVLEIRRVAKVVCHLLGAKVTLRV
jgi:hypothetical protein